MNPIAYNTVSFSRTPYNAYANHIPQDKLNVAAWVTVHDGHDFSARVQNRIAVDDSIVEPGKQIGVFVAAPSAKQLGAIRMMQRVPMVA